MRDSNGWMPWAAMPAAACMALPASAAPGAQIPIAVATFESIGLYWMPGADPRPEGCAVRFRKAGDTEWREGLPLWYDARNGECRGSLVQLAAGTEYEVRLGTAGTGPSSQLRVSTWPEQFPIARRIALPPGTSDRMLEIRDGGMADGYVLYSGDADSRSEIDVRNRQPYDVRVSAPYVIVRGLVLKGAQQDAIRLDDNAHDVVIEDNDISNWGRASGKKSRFGYAIGVDEDSGIHAVCAAQGAARVVIQRNRIHDPRYGANSWAEGHPAGPQGISFDSCGGNHVIRYNEIVGAPRHHFNDGIGGSENFSEVGFPNADADIHGNRIEYAWDDCIEAEGGDRNVRVWGNYCNQTCTGVASTVVAVGPLYVFRNVYNRSRQLEGVPPDEDRRNVFAKSGTLRAIGGGRRYLFHNTLLQARQAGARFGLGAVAGVSGTGTDQPISNTVSRNNIFETWKAGPAVFQSGTGNDYGYDLYSGLPGVIEVNGVAGVPVYAPGNGWTSEAGGRYQQAPESPGVDRGQRIPNFNDDYRGAAPDIGAAEAGAPPMVFGVTGGAR